VVQKNSGSFLSSSESSTARRRFDLRLAIIRELTADCLQESGETDCPYIDSIKTAEEDIISATKTLALNEAE